MNTHSRTVDAKKNSCYLLRLPEALRQSIYHHAGILGSDGACVISLSSRCPRVPGRNRPAPAFHTTWSLLCTSRVIYGEVAAQVYANNRFYLRVRDKQDFDVLRNLSLSSLRSLTWLTLHLNVVSCGLGLYCDLSVRPWDIRYGSNERDTPMRLSNQSESYEDHAAESSASQPWHWIREWHAIWSEYLRPNIAQPGRLRLELICDVEDINTGARVVQPLFEDQYPRLAGCSVRLSHRRQGDLQSLALKATEYACHSQDDLEGTVSTSQTSYKGFRFFDLPPELRQRILAYTDLITPTGEVEWSPSSGMSYRYRAVYRRETTPSAQFVHGCSADYHPLSDSFPDGQRPCWTSALLGCYCPARHSAASTIRHCDCWIPPTSILLASRAMRQEALPILFGSNRFVVAPERSNLDIHIELRRSLGHRLPALGFLTGAVARAGLKYLRRVDFNFPPLSRFYDPHYTTHGELELTQWRAAAETAANYLDLPKLSLRVFFPSWWPDDNHCGVYSEQLYKAHNLHLLGHRSAEDMRRACEAVLAPLRSWKGLRRFFVHLHDPLHPSFGDAKRANRHAEEEAKMEQFVMGSEYDALACGKEQEPSSQWMVEHEMIPSETPDY